MRWINVKQAGVLLNEQDINDSCNSYCLVMTKDYGWMAAMYASGEWYSSYSCKIAVEITHFMIVEKVK